MKTPRLKFTNDLEGIISASIPIQPAQSKYTSTFVVNFGKVSNTSATAQNE